MQFSGKIGQVVCWYPPWEILDPPLLVFFFYLSKRILLKLTISKCNTHIYALLLNLGSLRQVYGVNTNNGATNANGQSLFKMYTDAYTPNENLCSCNSAINYFKVGYTPFVYSSISQYTTAVSLDCYFFLLFFFNFQHVFVHKKPSFFSH